MKRMLAITTVCGLAGVALALNIPSVGPKPAAQAPAARPAESGLVVHEWGTFTGFAGSDGVHIPFGTTVGNDLPAFVFSRGELATRQNPQTQWIDWGKGGGVFALQRMETPVVYFYTDRPRDVSVAVDFPQGLLTEFYPPVRAMAPAFGTAPGEPRFTIVNGESPSTQPAPRPLKLERSSLDWGSVRITPPAQAEHVSSIRHVPPTPEAAAHYAYARETDAATVRFSDRPGEYHDERFLFYRGLGDFTLPVTLAAPADDCFEMNNQGPHPIEFALLLHVADGRARFAQYHNVTGRQAMTLPAETVAVEDVGEAIARALVAEGLFEKEARAMVKTWRSNWLGDPGTRVLYTVPRAVTDGLLPLRVSPTPDQTVRVLVGRIDVMTPQQEARVQSLLAATLHAKTLAPDDADFLRGFGRFADTAIRRAANLRASPDANAEINALRWRYRDTVQAAQAHQAAAAAAATPATQPH